VTFKGHSDVSGFTIYTAVAYLALRKLCAHVQYHLRVRYETEAGIKTVNTLYGFFMQ